MSISRTELKKFTSLNRKSKRKEHGLFIVEGEKNCLELLKSKVEIIKLCVSSRLIDRFPNGEECSISSLNRISQLKNSSEVIAICKIPLNESYKNNKKPIIYLDSISDPGNLGSIIRSLDWFGYNHIFCSEDTVDAYNNKVVMSSMGSIFRINIHYREFEELRNEFIDFKVIITSLDGENINSSDFVNKSILVIGNESNGVSDDIKKQSERKIKIPGYGFAESLNASVATGIILYELSKINLQK